MRSCDFTKNIRAQLLWIDASSCLDYRKTLGGDFSVPRLPPPDSIGRNSQQFAQRFLADGGHLRLSKRFEGVVIVHDVIPTKSVGYSSRPISDKSVED